MGRAVRALGATAAAVVAFGIGAGTAGAANIPVNTTADSGIGSLRAAITTANGNGQPDTISITATGPIFLATALPAIGEAGHATDIQGPGRANLGIHGSGSAFRIFDITAGTTVTISELTAVGGGGGEGGGARVLSTATLNLIDVHLRQNGTAAHLGGGISSQGTLMIDDSLLDRNTGASGGGIFLNGGTATVTDTTISGNTTAVFGDGGGIANIGGTVLTIGNSTVTGNSSTGSAGISNSNGAVLNIRNTTVAANTGGLGGIGNSTGSTVNMNAVSVIGNQGGSTGGTSNTGTFNVVNSLWAGNTAQDAPSCYGTYTSSGYNLRQTADLTDCGGFMGPEDLVNANPMVGTLGSYGGLTQTIPLLSGSPAIGGGNPGTPDGIGAHCPPTDQRGQPRDGAAGRCDIGAFELQASDSPTPPPSSSPPPSSPAVTPVPPVKKCKKGRKLKRGKCVKKRKR